MEKMDAAVKAGEAALAKADEESKAETEALRDAAKAKMASAVSAVVDELLG